jgi:hypothetical protein
MWIEDENGDRKQVFSRFGSSKTVSGGWHPAKVSLDPWAGQKIRIVIQAADGGSNSTVEALIDDVRVERAA